MPPSHYDPASPSEITVPLPCAPCIHLAPGISIQPPLSRRGYGPGLILIVPHLPPKPVSSTDDGTGLSAEQLDPDPVSKWAEEGYAVLAIEGKMEKDLQEVLTAGVLELAKWQDKNDDEVVKDKFGMIVYDESLIPGGITLLPPSLISHLVLYTTTPIPHPSIPTLIHLSPSSSPNPSTLPKPHVLHRHPHPLNFSLPSSSTYDAPTSSLAHASSLSFLKKGLKGPTFDLEAIWEEHTLFEFGERSVAMTMGTMVAEPYVNHIPTLTGGIGRKALTAFYRDHFIFSNPTDVLQSLISRCLGIDRLVEEFIFSFTHTCEVDWLLPGVPPTGMKVEIPMVAMVGFRGDRLYHEHISWDQATVYRQIGLLPTHVPFGASSQPLRLPTLSGNVSALKLASPGSVPSNQMMCSDFGMTWS